MKQCAILFLLVIAMPLISLAQPGGREHGDRGGYQKAESSSLSVFSENGDLFYLVLNGVNQNNAPTNKIRVEGLPQYGNDVQVMFADNVTPGIRRKINIADPVDGKAVSMTLKIERSRNGGAMLRFDKCREVEHNFRPERGEYVMNYGNPTQISYTDNYTDPDGRQVTTTTTTYSQNQPNNPPPPPPPPVPQAMDSKSFNDAIATIKNASFSDTKMSTAKTIFGVNYLNTTQVIAVCNQFSFEEDKLNFIAFAYSKIVDPANAFKLGAIFTFSSNKEALNKLITENQR